MTGSGAFVLRWGDESTLDALPAEADHVVLHAGRDEQWLLLDSPERFGAWAETVADRVSATRWTTIDGLNDWPVRAYASGGWRPIATGRLLRALDHQLAGHVLALRVLRARFADAPVEVGLVHRDSYELEGLLRDALDAPTDGITRAELRDHLRRRREEHELANPPGTPKQWVRRKLVATAVPLELALPRSLGAAYAAVEAGVR